MIRPARALAIGLLAAGALAPNPASAQSCCLSATAAGIGRLLSWEQAAVGLQLSFNDSLGYFGTDGRFRRANPDYVDNQYTATLWSLVDLGHKVTLYGSLPVVLDQRSAGNLGSGVGGGTGEVSGGLRWDAIPVGSHPRLPALALTLTATLPTGRSTAQALLAGDALGATITGRGAFVLAAGATVEKTALKWFIRGTVVANVPLPMTQPGTAGWQRFGAGFTATLMAGGELYEDLVLSGLLRCTWEDNLTVGNQAIRDTWILDPGAGLALSWRADPHVTLQAGVDSSLFLDLLGHNTPARVTATVGVRYGRF